MSLRWQTAAIESLRLAGETLHVDAVERLCAICRSHGLDCDKCPKDLAALVHLVSTSARARGDLHAVLSEILDKYVH